MRKMLEVELDYVSMEARLPQEKLQHFKALVGRLLGSQINDTVPVAGFIRSLKFLPAKLKGEGCPFLLFF